MHGKSGNQHTPLIETQQDRLFLPFLCGANVQPFCCCKFEYVKTHDKLLRHCSHSIQLSTFRNMQLQSNQKFRRKKKKDHKAQTKQRQIWGLVQPHQNVFSMLKSTHILQYMNGSLKHFFKKLQMVSHVLQTFIPTRICGLRSVSMLSRATLVPLLFSEWKQMQPLFF